MKSITQSEINFYLQYGNDSSCSDEIKKECLRIKKIIESNDLCGFGSNYQYKNCCGKMVVDSIGHLNSESFSENLDYKLNYKSVYELNAVKTVDELKTTDVFNWKKIFEDTTSGNCYHIDVDRIEKHNGLIFYLLLTDLAEPFSGEYSSIRGYQVDCAEGKQTVFIYASYSQPMGKGNVLGILNSFGPSIFGPSL